MNERDARQYSLIIDDLHDLVRQLTIWHRHQAELMRLLSNLRQQLLLPGELAVAQHVEEQMHRRHNLIKYGTIFHVVRIVNDTSLECNDAGLDEVKQI